MPERAYPYSIDADDRLRFVGEAWLEFARENEAPELEHAVGRRIWDFIQGRETRDLYRVLFERIRSRGTGAAIPFRCDAPDRYRFMRLEMSPEAGGAIDFTGVLVREQTRVYLPMLDRVLRRADYGFPMCSLCKKVLLSGAWLELEEAVEQFGRFDSTRPPSLEQTVCDACKRSAGGLVEGAA